MTTEEYYSTVPDLLGAILAKAIDIEALKKLIENSCAESYSDIIYHLAGLAFLAYANIYTRSAYNRRADTTRHLAHELKMFAENKHFKNYLAKMIHLNEDLRNGRTQQFVEVFDTMNISLFRK